MNTLNATTQDAHPHDWDGGVPDRLPAAAVRALSELSPARALGALAAEWAMIAGAAGLALQLDHPLAYAGAVVLIGARQHALAILAHDASHHRFLKHRGANDLVANLFCSWPVFASVQGFRYFHGPHHRFTEQEGDGNRALWGTHDAEGHRSAEWTFPKSRGALAAQLAWRACGLTGLRWMLRGFIGPVLGLRRRGRQYGHVSHLLFWAIVAAALTAVQGWSAFLLLWVLPFVTWQVLVQYVRLICEHSAVQSAHPAYALTRSTLPPAWQRLLFLPLNVGHHVEHHWYPSVPFYRLPQLHAALMEQPGFREHVVIERSVFSALAHVTEEGAR
ncbi:MAG: fatty acid desaturase family protein [Alphaproteobacteria bacterium]|nr:fatty acid desaturase family protein [Alphaproteobacteria bacterium]MCB9791287.1 fatty acid desaturase family protein [Alphaproteobacteria bacterium]